jgi:hypothetical protein
MFFACGGWLASSLGSDGLKISSSVPRNRELSNASESSTRKSQVVRYVTTTEKGPAGESVIPKAYSATVLSLLLNSGTVRLSG